MLLLKCISREYYRQNFAFYALIVFVAFGFMSGREHMQLTSVIISRPQLLLFVVVVWFLHVLKSTQFFSMNLKLPENQLFQDFTLRPISLVISELILLQVTLNLPFLSYAIFMITVAFSKEAHLAGFLVLLINLILIIVPAAWHFSRLRNFHVSMNNWSVVPSLPGIKLPSLFFLRHLLQNKITLFVTSKLYGILLLIGCARLFPTDDYDQRLLAIAIFLAGLGQMAIAREFRDFTNSKMQFERSLPLTITNRFFYLFMGSCFLVIPEILILNYYWFSLLPYVYVISASLCFISVQVFWLAAQFISIDFFENYQTRLFFAGLFHFMLIMFHIPVILFAAAFVSIAWFIFIRNYYTFETSV